MHGPWIWPKNWMPYAAGIRADVSWFTEFAEQLNYHAGAGLYFAAGS